MHKKWNDRVELTKKTSHCKSRAFSSKTSTKNEIIARSKVIYYANRVLLNKFIKMSGLSDPRNLKAELQKLVTQCVILNP